VSAQRIQQSISLIDGAHSGEEVDDGLGGKSWDGSAPDMLDGGETTRQEFEETIPLRCKLCCPSRIVRFNVDFFGDGASQGIICGLHSAAQAFKIF
jgi:hypothetical protein